MVTADRFQTRVVNGVVYLPSGAVAGRAHETWLGRRVKFVSPLTEDGDFEMIVVDDSDDRVLVQHRGTGLTIEPTSSYLKRDLVRV